MKQTLDALKALYVNLGGELTDIYENIDSGTKVGNYTNIPDMIEAVTQKISGSGGSGMYIEEVKMADEPVYELTATAGEIINAVKKGQNVVIKQTSRTSNNVVRYATVGIVRIDGDGKIAVEVNDRGHDFFSGYACSSLDKRPNVTLD